MDALAQCECSFKTGERQKGKSRDWQQMIWPLEYFTSFVLLSRAYQFIRIWLNEVFLLLAVACLEIDWVYSQEFVGSADPAALGTVHMPEVYVVVIQYTGPSYFQGNWFRLLICAWQGPCGQQTRPSWTLSDFVCQGIKYSVTRKVWYLKFVF